MRLVCAVVAVVGLGGCFCGDGTGGGAGGGEGGGGGSSKSTLSYDLIEMTGEFKLTGTSTTGSCSYVTTDSRTVLSLAKPDLKTITYVPKFGLLSGYASGTRSLPARAGTETCGTTAPKACPTFPDQPYTGEAFLSISSDPPMLGNDAPGGVAFVPVIGGILPRDLCQNTPFDVSPIWLRGKPVTVAQLMSGRFVVEGSGTAPIIPPVPELGDGDPTPVTGSLAYTFRLVFQTADYDAKNAVAPVDLPTFDHCLLDIDPTPAEEQAARDAYAAGATDIALNATGCRRLKVTRAAGSESVAYEVTVGTRLVFDAAAGTTRAEPDVRVAYVRTQDAAGIHEQFDSDEDGTVDRTMETTFDGGVWAATVARETGPDPTTASRIRVDATTMRVIQERGGTVLDELIAPIQQRSCFDANSMQAPDCRPPPGPTPTCKPGDPVLCDSTTAGNLKTALAAAVKKGAKCLKDTGLKPNPAKKIATLVTQGKLNFYCTDNPCGPLGLLNTAPNADGSMDILYNTVLNNTPAETARTLFHESLHGDPGFTHDDTLDKAASNACKLQITDRTFACETMCFNPQAANKCVCMRCLSADRFYKATQAVCSKCDAFGSCAGRTEAGKSIASAVGAWCGRGKVFCDTKAECDTACAPYGGGCQQLKATCDAGCN